MRQPQQEPCEPCSLQESKQHIVRSLAAAGMRYPIQSGPACFSRESTAGLRPLEAEISCTLALVSRGFCAQSREPATTSNAANETNLRAKFMCGSYLLRISIM